MSRARLVSGALVVFTALVTWLPYGVVYGFMRLTPSGSKALVYIFFYFSIVSNPIIYGFALYKCDIFREGCSECCFGEESEVEPNPQPAGFAPRVVEPRSFTDLGSATSDITDSVTRDGGTHQPQFQDRVQVLSNSSMS